ncbi:ETS-related transcription factor Elf-5-like isoform X1 [Neodiprion fabricii]|uniref:ETS-related transcription factor Elf-5-like isoform X1 n=1 Tax=Neodiprion fabricii TaxID=2872261 RepID=UPI001ED8E71B|nr:ETS-related transcription factor Elf-5-like isoform X1 [Neodiprion fabricii]XP_046431436.1 ETS-related transcription factor Elf-5-like isoform X1 [Neodiprion fabricii]XP_046431437.1 ETS-related transcription factor Elf-5-like isoform X1 [Neodiprion fabricii]XP_046431439.1 ETS-related transcription factor Elf-5-like isoform X1 [Neodiprion fabricii]
MSIFDDLFFDVNCTDFKSEVSLNKDNETQRSDIEIPHLDIKLEDPNGESDDSNKENSNEDLEDWRKKPVNQWDEKDTKKWLISTIIVELRESYDVCCRSEKLVMPGQELLRLSKNNFINLCGTIGSRLFELLPKQSAPKTRHRKKSPNIHTRHWQKKKVEQWNTTDTKNWLLWTSIELNIFYDNICTVAEKFSMPGNELRQLSLQDFINRDPINGEKFYESLREERNVKHNDIPFQRYRVPYSDDETSADSTVSISDAESVSNIDLARTKVERKGRSGSHTLWVWEFLRDLLRNPKYCPEYVYWKDYSKKIFCLVKNKEIAQMWGKRKKIKKKEMNYDKFSRALRYHYKKGTLESVDKERLTYRFGPAATGLETDDPNFEKARVKYQL